ncbi:MAG: sugar nucleotide-binding protein [Candidatus Peribacteraceae bacterium]
MADIIIFGGKGFIGAKLALRFPGAALPSVDIADPTAVRQVLESEKPSVVINAAGKTGKPNVDWCEDHKMETLRSNVTGPLVLLEECLQRGIYFAHIGSGCIYDGEGSEPGGFTEEDKPNFTGSFYSLTKAMSDQLLAPFPVLQVRIRMPFDDVPGPRNLITKLLGFKKVLDVRNSITYIPDFLDAFEVLVKKRATGIYNIVSSGAVSPYEIMQCYRKLVDPKHAFERLILADLPTVVKAARSNCILSNSKLQKEVITVLPVEAAVDRALMAYKHAL